MSFGEKPILFHALRLFLTVALLPFVEAVTTRRIRSCLPEGIDVALGVSTPVRCPCLARFAAQSSERPSDAIKLDFLIVYEREARRIREIGRPDRIDTIDYIKRYSAFDVKPDIFDLSIARYVHLTNPVTITEEGQFSLIIRSSSPSRNCDVEPQFVLEPLPATCPRRLPPTSRSIVGDIHPFSGLRSFHDLPVLRNEQGFIDVDRNRQNIVGGSASLPREQLQGLASITRSGSIICGGSLLSPSWVVTAAHCRVQISDRVLIGGQYAGGGIPYFVEDVKVHPKYVQDQQGVPYDIALVRLSSEAHKAKPYLLPSGDTSLAVDTYVRAAGYGSYSESWPTLATDEARIVDIPVVSIDTCKANYANRSQSLADSIYGSLQFCAGFEDGMCDACLGDSGSPATVYDTDGNVVQLGLVSFGVGCARPRTPGVYTFLPAFLDWMKEMGVDFSVSTRPLQIVKASSRNSGVSPTEGATFVNVWGDQNGTDGTTGDVDGGISDLAVGICAGVGAILLLLLLAVLLFLCCRKCKGKGDDSANDRLCNMEQGGKSGRIFVKPKRGIGTSGLSHERARAGDGFGGGQMDRSDHAGHIKFHEQSTATRRSTPIDDHRVYDEPESSEGDRSTTFFTARNSDDDRSMHVTDSRCAVPHPFFAVQREQSFEFGQVETIGNSDEHNIDLRYGMDTAASNSRTERRHFDYDAPSSDS